jgi:hypothetical protein
MSDIVAREVRLHIDGGPGKKMPVRCEGYVEERRFHIEAVWIDGVVLGASSACGSYDIIENLKPSVIEALEEEATDSLHWEGV